MQWMTELYPSMGFDCASEREIAEASQISKNILYAQPCKKKEDIQVAQAKGIDRTVADSVEEIEKLAEAGWTGEIFVRLLVSDTHSKQPFGKKFGAPYEWLPKMYDVARYHKLNMTGFSFHVGSECESPIQYEHAIRDCRDAQEVAGQYGFATKVVDIGGGFLPEKKSFVEVAECVQRAHAKYFPDPAVQMIAEPGRFFAAPTHTLYTTVIGKKPVWPPPTAPHEPAWRITIDESVYGSFSNIPFDHQAPTIERIRQAVAGERRRPTIVFGRTCDSGDCIGTDVPLYDVQVGDVLQIRNMGAYTTVTSSEFNGFPKPGKLYEM